MNAFSKTSFGQKLSKCAVMIIILLQTACAANLAKLGGGSNDWTVPKSSKWTSNGSGSSSTKSHPHSQRRIAESKPDANDASSALTCGFDMPEKVSARPAEESNLHEVEKTVQQTEEALQQAEDEVLHVIELIESWDGQPGAKKVIVGTTITGAAIGWLVADQNAKEVIQSVVTGGVAGAEIGNAINTTAATITTIGIMIVLW